MGARVIAIGVLMLVGCGESIYACHGDASCKDGDRTGRCEPNGACSFPDPDCPSGYRFGAHASNGLAGECVPDDPIAGTDTGSTTTMSATTTSTTRDVTSEGGAESTTVDATTSGVGESTTMPVTDTTAESSGANSTTGPSEGDPYGSCEQTDCIAGSQCEPDSALPLTCAPPCTTPDDCPPPVGGGAQPVCLGQGADKFCALQCSDANPCPDGMECDTYEPSYGNLCTWF